MGSIFRDNLMSDHVAIAKKKFKICKNPNIYCKIYIYLYIEIITGLQNLLLWIKLFFLRYYSRKTKNVQIPFKGVCAKFLCKNCAICFLLL